VETQIRSRLDDFIRSKGLRQTAQRDRIVEAIFESDDHFTVDELIERLKLIGEKASRATVYRTLGLLTEAGLLHQIDIGDDQTTYDPNFLDKPTHNHLICVDCGKVSEFEDSHLDTLNDCISRRMGFRAVSQSLKIEACCDKLRLTGRCENLIQARLEGKRLPKRK